MATEAELRRRVSKTSSAALTIVLTADSTSPIIDMRTFASAGFVITATSGGAASLTFWGACDSYVDATGMETNGTLGQIFDSGNTALGQNITSGNAYALQDQCFPFAYIQIRANTGTVTIQPSRKT